MPNYVKHTGPNIGKPGISPFRDAGLGIPGRVLDKDNDLCWLVADDAAPSGGGGASVDLSPITAQLDRIEALVRAMLILKS